MKNTQTRLPKLQKIVNLSTRPSFDTVSSVREPSVHGRAIDNFSHIMHHQVKKYFKEIYIKYLLHVLAEPVDSECNCSISETASSC